MSTSVCLMRTKIHRATVTEANLNYIGSITIDRDLIDAAGLFLYEQVHIVNVNNGQRFVTYVIEGERGSGTICLNGAAARLASPGDIIIIIAYANMDLQEAADFKPKAILVDGDNKLKNDLL
ncbi:MAG: aspartate 1-decarboxylase [Candidatus Paracaedibacteraceae bacterium]|nr:aspartate 1-decarboxylase [Candidatus Paracaedibacteraceae bacterium]